jgi:hypothetical protein
MLDEIKTCVTSRLTNNVIKKIKVELLKTRNHKINIESRLQEQTWATSLLRICDQFSSKLQ